MPPKRPRPTSVELEIDQLIEDNLDIDIKPIFKNNSEISEEDLVKDIKPSRMHAPTSSPARKRSKSNTQSNIKTPKSTPTKSTLSPVKSETPLNAASAKARLAEIIIESGLKGYNRNQVELETGLTKNQQIEMLKKGRGSLWKALYGFASTL
ncbi:hypothetical protein V865_007079 [Kwoniella europaea PYCC6329]|uniref:Uncharacterized protein n=1 Tax=Kwoniella europaea PYCC6329 TaxID=1423913 RepID=A0AAX4KSU2_9TREE